MRSRIDHSLPGMPPEPQFEDMIRRELFLRHGVTDPDAGARELQACEDLELEAEMIARRANQEVRMTIGTPPEAWGF